MLRCAPGACTSGCIHTSMSLHPCCHRNFPSRLPRISRTRNSTQDARKSMKMKERSPSSRPSIRHTPTRRHLQAHTGQGGGRSGRRGFWREEEAKAKRQACQAPKRVKRSRQRPPRLPKRCESLPSAWVERARHVCHQWPDAAGKLARCIGVHRDAARSQLFGNFGTIETLGHWKRRSCAVHHAATTWRMACRTSCEHGAMVRVTSRCWLHPRRRVETGYRCATVVSLPMYLMNQHRPS